MMTTHHRKWHTKVVKVDSKYSLLIMAYVVELNPLSNSMVLILNDFNHTKNDFWVS